MVHSIQIINDTYSVQRRRQIIETVAIYSSCIAVQCNLSAINTIPYLSKMQLHEVCSESNGNLAICKFARCII
jgi:hypothetical protein